MTFRDERAVDSLLTEKVLAQRWLVTPGHLRNQRSAGQGLSYVKLGRSVRYRLSDVQAFEQAHLVTQQETL